MDQTNRYDLYIYNNASLKKCANLLASRIGRKITQAEAIDLISFVNVNRTKDWTGRTDDDVRRILIKDYLVLRFTDIGREQTRRVTDPVDIHELLKQHMGTGDDNTPDSASSTNVNEDGFVISAGDAAATSTDATVDTPAGLGNLDSVNSINSISTISAVANVQQIFGQSDFNSVINALNPSGTVRKNYIFFDTRYKAQNTDGTTVSWNFLSNSSTNTPGGINSIGDIKNVTSIKVYPFKIPYQDVIVSNAYNRVTMLIQEFSGQAFIGQEGRKFHFIFETEIDNNMIKLTPLPPPFGLFEFAKPITQIDTLTLSFGMPLEPIIFDIDRGSVTVAYTNPAQFTMTNNVPHTLTTGDQVYFSGFTSGDTINDYTTINLVNNINGYTIYTVDDYTFEVTIDLSQMVAPIQNIVVGVYFGSKRILIPLELGYYASSGTSSTSF